MCIIIMYNTDIKGDKRLSINHDTIINIFKTIYKSVQLRRYFAFHHPLQGD